VAHAAASDGYRPLSTAMVNVRATLAAAEHAGAIGEGTARALVRLAKEMFYADRVYPAILRRGAEEGLPAEELDRLRAFLREGQVDQKRLDAVAMLHAVREHLASTPGPKKVRYRFEHTDAWDTALRKAGGLSVGAEQEDVVLTEALAD